MVSGSGEGFNTGLDAFTNTASGNMLERQSVSRSRHQPHDERDRRQGECAVHSRRLVRLGRSHGNVDQGTLVDWASRTCGWQPHDRTRSTGRGGKDAVPAAECKGRVSRANSTRPRRCRHSMRGQACQLQDKIANDARMAPMSSTRRPASPTRLRRWAGQTTASKRNRRCSLRNAAHDGHGHCRHGFRRRPATRWR